MPVRFIIGRAGVGKTHRCVTAIQHELAAAPLEGPPLVLLVPEQASLQMERALLSGEIRAMARAEVLSFRRLAYRILQHAGAPQRDALSPEARAMVLRRLLQQLAPQLRFYKRVERMTGFFDRLGNTLSELLEEAVTPEELRLASADAALPPARAAKFADLAEIYAAYLAYLGDDKLDAGQHLQLAREVLPRTTYLATARAWVDGFAGFTRQELLLLTVLARRAESVEIALLADPAQVREAQAGGAIDPAGLFARPLRTLQAVHRAFAREGIDVLEPVVLEPPAPPRLADTPELIGLEKNFGRIAGEEPDDRLESLSHTEQQESLSHTERPESQSHTDHSYLQIVEAPDRRTEVEFAVTQVCRWVQEHGDALRYRDIAIIVRDFGPYGDLLAASLAARNVPFFLDQRRGLAHHPLVEFLRGAMLLAVTPYAIEPLRLLLKTELLGLPRDDADELENYLLAHGLTGPQAWASPPWEYLPSRRERSERSPAETAHLARVNASRRHVQAIFDPFIPAIGAILTGAQWAERLEDLLQRIEAENRLEQWALEAESDGDAEAAAAHRQTFDAVRSLLAELARHLPEAQLDPAEAAAVIEAGLSELTLGLIPPTLDQVLVGSIERSRHPEIKAAILLGFNDGVIPNQAAEDSILNDDDRKALEPAAGPVGVPSDQRLLDEKLLAYIALTRASGRLVILYSATDEAGAALRPSPYLELVQQACPGVRMLRLPSPIAARSTWPIQTAADLVAALVAEFRRRPPREKDDEKIRRRWNDLYLRARIAPTLRDALSAAAGALVFQNRATLSPKLVKQALASPYRASVSELETYAACGYRHFARYVLRLDQRRERDLEPTEVGTIHHAILEDFLGGCIEENTSFVERSAEELLSRLEESAQRVRDKFSGSKALAAARDAYLMARSARDLALVISQQREVAAGGKFRPRFVELGFGIGKARITLPPVTLATPKGRKVELRGYIDRVDLAEVGNELLGLVVDYKRTLDKRLNLCEVLHGLSLQLLGYLLALQEHGEALTGRKVVPIGAFYVTLRRRYRLVKHPSEADPDSDRSAIPRGLLNLARLNVLEENAGSGWAKHYQVYITKEGGLGRVNSSDAATPEEFDALLAHVRHRMAALADDLLDGNIAIAPYRLNDFSPCTWCEMQSVCRFEFGEGQLRHLDALPRVVVLQRMRENHGQ